MHQQDRSSGQTVATTLVSPGPINPFCVPTDELLRGFSPLSGGR